MLRTFSPRRDWQQPYHSPHKEFISLIIFYSSHSWANKAFNQLYEHPRHWKVERREKAGAWWLQGSVSWLSGRRASAEALCGIQPLCPHGWWRSVCVLVLNL